MSEQINYGEMPPEPEDEEMDKVEAQEEKAAFDFEKGYGELHSKFGEQSNEIGTLRQQTQALQEQLAAAQQAQQQAPQEPATDYQKMLSEIAQKFDNGDITYEQSLLESNRITREMTLSESDQKMASLLEQVRGETQQLLTDKEADAVVKSFINENSDFLELQESGKLQEMVDADPLLDDLAAYYKLQATEAFEKGKMEAARIASGSQKAAGVLADAGASMQAQQPKLTKEGDLKASMLAALNG